MTSTVLGKKILCSTEKYNYYFDNFQLIGSDMLIGRYRSLKDIIVHTIHEEYRHFLAEPVVRENRVEWHTIPYSESPQVLAELTGEKREYYDGIKNKTLDHYQDVIENLRQNNKTDDADFLEKAVKFIDDRFVYCYDGITVAGVWGMKLKEHVTERLGEIVKYLCSIDKNEQMVEEKVEPPPVKKEEDKVTKVFPKKSRWRINFWKWALGVLISGVILWFLYLLLSHLGVNGGNVNGIVDGGDGGSSPGGGGPGGGGSGSGGGFGCSGPKISIPMLLPEPVPTPPRYDKILPPFQGVLPPIDTTKLIRKPGYPVIISNLLNILMENDDKTVMEFADDFKKKYPDEKYKIVYYDNLVKRIQIEVPPEERLALAQEIPVEFAPEYTLFVFDESLFEGSYTPNDPIFKNRDRTWYFYAIRAPQAWDITLGSNKTIVAVVDNGFSLTHPELRDKVVMPYNVWLRSAKIFPQKIDHGTHVAGTALAFADNKKGTSGIAPYCLFMPVQIADADGFITFTAVLDGLLYAIYRGAHVVNCSVGAKFTDLGAFPLKHQKELLNNHYKEEERLWNEIARIADKHGATIVVAAGNDNVLAGVDPFHRPAHFVTVTAVNKENLPFERAKFSNYGDDATISAPGVNIYSSTGKNNYSFMSGTSMAAPLVAGGIALMKSINNRLTSEQIISILQTTGMPTYGQIGPLLQLDKALEAVINDKLSERLEWEKEISNELKVN